MSNHRADWRRDRSLGQMIDNVVRFTIDTFDPRKADRQNKHRGRIAHRVKGLEKDEAQAEGGRYSAAAVGNASLLAISAAMAP